MAAVSLNKVDTTTMAPANGAAPSWRPRLVGKITKFLGAAVTVAKRRKRINNGVA